MVTSLDLMKSLFSPNRPANPKVFVGRDAIVEKIQKGCMLGLSYGLIGDAGVGKTSLLIAVKKTIISKQYNTNTVSFPVYLEFDKTRHKTPSDILSAILKGLMEEITNLTGLVYPKKLDVLDERILAFDKMWNSILEWYTKETRRRCKLVLLFDDLHRGESSNCLPDVLSILRPIVSREEISVVLSGELPLEKEFRNDVSSLRNLVVEQIYLPLLQKPDIQEILFTVEDYGLEVENGSLDLLFEFTNGHPYLIQFFLSEALRLPGKISIENIKTINSNHKNNIFLKGILKQNRQASSKDKVHSSMIKISFLVADPSNTTRLRLGEEQREIQNKILMGKRRDLVKFIPHTSVRPEDVSQALLNDEAKIIHFSGHGTPSGELCFENKTGKVHPVSPLALSNLFKQFAGQIECVLLNACYSERQAKAIVKHIPFVIGMKKEIGDISAIAFSIGFYQTIVAGKTIEEAYEMGCSLIGLEQGIDEMMVPVLLKKNQK